MPKRDIIVVGGSAGALEVLSSIVSKLPHDLAASVFVVLHISPSRESSLPAILTRAARMPAIQPGDQQAIEYGQIYVAPPDRHMLVENRHITVVHGPKENRSRPAIDPLFRSAAINYGPRVIGVVLSGSLDDGTAGLRAIKKSGGVAIVQDPEEATYPAMPESAIYNDTVDHVVPAAQIAPLLRQLVEHEVPTERGAESVSDDLRKEVEVAKQKLESEEMIETANQVGRLSMFTCPECQGSLWEIKDGELLRYRCHVGHAFSIASLAEGQAEQLEAALWSALRALEERGALARRLAGQSREREHGSLSARFEERAREADGHAKSIRKILLIDPEKSFSSIQ